MDGPGYGQDQHLLTIFPEEIWIIVFGLVNNPDDLFSCGNTTLLFKQILDPIRTIYLFPEVVKILDKLSHFNTSNSKELAKCRLVCSQWRQAVDNLLALRNHHHQFIKLIDFMALCINAVGDY